MGCINVCWQHMENVFIYFLESMPIIKTSVNFIEFEKGQTSVMKLARNL